MQDVERIDDLGTAKQMLRLFVKENERLYKRIEELTRQLAAARGTSEGEQLELEISSLKEQLGNFQRKLFGESSERRPQSNEEPAEPPKPKRGHGPRKQAELPVHDVLMELEEDERTCSVCGRELQPVPGMTEDSEVIAAIERSYYRINAMRQKYRCTCNSALVTAPGPLKHIPGGRYTLQFAVQVANDKYGDHLPLERQSRIMKRQGLVVDSNTLWDQIDALAKHLQPTYEALREYILGADVIGADETWWRLMKGRSSKKWWAWGLTTHDACWYRIAESRSAKVAAEVLDGFEGAVMCDGYKPYETVANAQPEIRLVHCWSHARRKFVEAEPHYPQKCGHAIDIIGKLFAIEAGLVDPDGLEGDAKQAALEIRAREREQKSRPLVEELRAWLLEQHALPKSGLRKAIEYVLRYWKGMTAFLDDPNLPFDNNRTERALRGMVLGRKNHYGSRSERGTEVAAIFYSLIESAKLCGVDPVSYLNEAGKLAIEKPGSILLPHQLVP